MTTLSTHILNTSTGTPVAGGERYPGTPKKQRVGAHWSWGNQ